MKPGLYFTPDGGIELVLPRVDRLPGHSGLDLDIDQDNGKIRWRGVRTGSVPMVSDWSPTYDLGALPDEICWDDLW